MKPMTPMTLRPYVGMPVHYVSYGTPNGEYSPEHRAATITALPKNGGTDVSLFVMNPDGTFHNHKVRYSEEWEPGTWHPIED